MLVDFTDDTTIIPKQSALFYDYNLFGTLLPFNETDLYQRDRIGLKQLHEANKVYIKHCPGDHLQIDDN